MLLKLCRCRTLAVDLPFQLSNQVLLRLQPALELRNLLLLALNESIETASLSLIRVIGALPRHLRAFGLC